VLKALFRPARFCHMVGACACSSTCPWILAHAGVRVAVVDRLPRELRLDQRVRSSTATLVLGRWPFLVRLDAWFGGRSRGIPGIVAPGAYPTIIGLHTRRRRRGPWFSRSSIQAGRPGTKRLFGVGFASLAIHYCDESPVSCTRRSRRPHDDRVRMDATVVLAPTHEQQRAPTRRRSSLRTCSRGSDRRRTGADRHRDASGGPPAALRSQDYSGSGVEDSRASDIVVSGMKLCGGAGGGAGRHCCPPHPRSIPPS